MKLLTLIFIFFSFNAFASSLTFKENGKVLNTTTIESIKQGSLAGVKKTEVTFYNPWRKNGFTYNGYDLFSVLTSVYGEKWKSASVIKLIAQDGYASISNIKAMIKAAEGKSGILAYSEKNQKGFSLVKRGERKIDPGPLYLIWTGFKKGNKVTYGDALKWPYQLKEIEIVNNQ